MAYTISPNMNLVVPTVGSESGPQYATDVNNSLTLIDQHDHSTGKGVQIQPDGLNISSALTFQNNPLTNAQYLNMYLQTTAPTVAQSLYVKDGSESPALPDLWYFDGANQIQITSGGELAPVTASISGITYAGGTFTFEQTQSSLPTTPADLSSGSITIRPNTAATTFGVQLNPSSSISSQYSLFLPLVPSSASFLTIDTSGNISGSIATANGITASNIAANTITATQIANNTITATQIANATITTTQISASAGITPTQLNSISAQETSGGSLSTTSTSYQTIVSLTPSSYIAGRPVFVFVGATNGGYIGLSGGGSSPQQLSGQFRVVKAPGTDLTEITLLVGANQGSYTTTNYYAPPGGLNCVDSNYSPGDQYLVQAKSASGNTFVVASGIYIQTVQL